MKIHCIGIGGIGVSALAQYYLAQGYKVSGSDLVASEITSALERKGITIFIGNSAEHITPDIDIVVHSPAVKPSNPEYHKAKSLGLTIKSYPKALGELTRRYFTIAVTGSHGKSTTTAMIGLVLIKAGLNPTVIVGTKLKEFGDNNFHMGNSRFLVIEACEYDDSFRHYSADIAVITNIDKEHLDYFETMEGVVEAFETFIEKLPKKSLLIANRDDGYATAVAEKQNQRRVLYYSLRLQAQKNQDIAVIAGKKDAAIIKQSLGIPGSHNVSNALAVLSVARVLKISDEVTFKVFPQYHGSWRRFEVKEKRVNQRLVTIVSDYGHHPTEVIATLKAAREKFPGKKIWCIFQPHQYQRTYYLMKDFVKLFKKVPVNQVIITDIYDVAGREEKKISGEVSAQSLVKKVGKRTVIYLPTKEIPSYMQQRVKRGDVVVVMGAGDIYTLIDRLV